MKKLLAFVSALAFSAPAFADFVDGTIVNVTSTPAGLFIMVTGGALPANCSGTSGGWMMIPESAKTMIAVVLISRIQNTPARVFTSPIDGSGFCQVNQIDPAG